MDDLSAPDLSAPEGASDASPSAPDRVSSLSARLSEALTAVGIAVRRREAEIELIDRTLLASSDAQSAAARQAAERMARVRAEHADELSLMQRARRALEDATSDAGEISYQLDTHVEQSATAAREAEELRRTVAGLRGEIVEQRSRVTETEAFVVALGDDLEAAKENLAARERDLEQAEGAAVAREREIEQLRDELEKQRKELEVKTREAEELGRLMGAFTSGDAPAADDVSDDEARAADAVASDDASITAPAATPSVEHLAAAVETLVEDPVEDPVDDANEDAVDEPPAPPAALELVPDPLLEAETTRLPRFVEAPDIDIPVPAVEDAMDEMAGVEAMPSPDVARARAGHGANGVEMSDDALVFEGEGAERSAANDDVSDADADEPSLEDDAAGDEEPEAVAAASAPDDDESGALASDVDDAIPDAPVDISVDDWGAVVEDEPAVALPGPNSAASARTAVDGELQAYLSAMREDGDSSPPSSSDALFKATSDISAFKCGSPEEVRLAGALQLQSWRPSELAQLIGMKEDVVRAKLTTYHERGLVEIVRG